MSADDLVFYFAKYSTANSTLAIFAELEHAYGHPLCTRKELSLQAGDASTPEYLRGVNPNGWVPAIVHHGVAIWESAAIAIYLGETFGVAKGLFPAVGPQRGEALKWIIWVNVNLMRAAISLQAGPVAATPGAPQKAVGSAADSGDQLDKFLRVLDSGLAGRDYLLGAQYTLADTHVSSFVDYLAVLEVKLDAYENVTEWRKKVAERPALKSLV